MRLKLLDALRSGDSKRIDKLVEDLSVEVTMQNSEILGLRETILHYAVQVSPLSTIKYIVESVDKFPFVDINSQDKEGNTPLHLAAASSRLEVVRYLLSLPNINDTILNGNKEQPVEMCKDLNIAQVMQYERAKFVETLALSLREYFINRDYQELEKLLVGNLRAAELLDINGADPETGNTVLHEFISKNDLEMCKWILKHGGDPFRRDKKGCLPSDLVDPKNEPLRKLLQSASKEQTMMDPVQNSQNSGKAGVIPTYKGYLRKWTNFAGGYKLRYFVLDSNGILSYYTDQDDTSNACRGSINLGYATLHLDSSEKLKFEIIGKNGIRLHLKANHATETNRWVWNLQNAITISKDNIKRRLRGSIVDEQPDTPGSSNSPEALTGNAGNNNVAIPSYTVTETSSIEDSKHYVPSNLGNAPDDEPKRKLSLESKTKKLLRIPRRMKRRSHKRISSVGSTGSFEDDSAPPSRSNSLTRISFENRSVTSLTDSIKYRNFDDQEDLENFDNDVDEDEDSSSETEIYSKRSGITDSVSGVTADDSELAFTIKRSIDMEIAGFVDLITKLSHVKKEDPEDAEFCEVGLNTMNTISDLLSKYNKLVSTREKRTLVKLERQLEINKLWEQSIRQLESEFQSREEKLAAYEGQRKQLKKIIKSGSLNKVPQVLSLEGQAPESADISSLANGEAIRRASIASIAGGDTALEDELEEILEDSEDEFFDADELIDDNDEVQGEKPELDEQDTLTRTTVAEKPDLETVHEKKEAELKFTLGTSEAELAISGEIEISKESEARGYITVANGGLKVVNEPQLKKKLLIEKEDSYNGYENPPRTKLLLDEDDRPKVGLWGVVKSMIGKDMTRMTLPVSFNEPTSLLQRLAEDIEYSTLLDTAAGYDDSTLRMIYVAAFAASEYASTIDRIAKPFNPLLGETFEYCRPDKNYRLITEQVSHHPPISACHVESVKWDYYGENAVDSKFRGRLFDVKHLGKMFCVMRPDNGVIDENGKKVTEELYSWKKVNTAVVGIMIGNPTVDNYGAMHVTNHTTGDVMVVDMKQRGWRASSAYQLSGQACDSSGKAHWAMAGHWNSKIFAKHIKDMKVTGEASNIIDEGGNSTDPYGGKKFLVWQCAPRPKVPFNLTAFATTLNGIDDALRPWLPPTDTRLRPDQRAMEDGKYDFAADEKNRVEVKQRKARKEREIAKKVYRPNWFVKRRHPVTGDAFWEFNHTYWNRRAQKDLADSGDIF